MTNKKTRVILIAILFAIAAIILVASRNQFQESTDERDEIPAVAGKRDSERATAKADQRSKDTIVERESAKQNGFEEAATTNASQIRTLDLKIDEQTIRRIVSSIDEAMKDENYVAMEELLSDLKQRLRVALNDYSRPEAAFYVTHATRGLEFLHEAGRLDQSVRDEWASIAGQLLEDQAAPEKLRGRAAIMAGRVRFSELLPQLADIIEAPDGHFNYSVIQQRALYAAAMNLDAEDSVRLAQAAWRRTREVNYQIAAATTIANSGHSEAVEALLLMRENRRTGVGVDMALDRLDPADVKDQVAGLAESDVLLLARHLDIPAIASNYEKLEARFLAVVNDRSVPERDKLAIIRGSEERIRMMSFDTALPATEKLMANLPEGEAFDSSRQSLARLRKVLLKATN